MEKRFILLVKFYKTLILNNLTSLCTLLRNVNVNEKIMGHVLFAITKYTTLLNIG